MAAISYQTGSYVLKLTLFLCTDSQLNVFNSYVTTFLTI